MIQLLASNCQNSLPQGDALKEGEQAESARSSSSSEMCTPLAEELQIPTAAEVCMTSPLYKLPHLYFWKTRSCRWSVSGLLCVFAMKVQITPRKFECNLHMNYYVNLHSTYIYQLEEARVRKVEVTVSVHQYRMCGTNSNHPQTTSSAGVILLPRWSV
jgi:hypothetical protein